MVVQPMMVWSKSIYKLLYNTRIDLIIRQLFVFEIEMFCADSRETVGPRLQNCIEPKSDG